VPSSVSIYRFELGVSKYTAGASNMGHPKISAGHLNVLSIVQLPVCGSTVTIAPAPVESVGQ